MRRGPALALTLVIGWVTAVAAAASEAGGRLRVVVASMAFRGHAMPLLNLADELEARGHDVRFAIQEEGVEWVVEHWKVRSRLPEWVVRTGSGPLSDVEVEQDAEERVISLGSMVHGPSSIRKHLYSIVGDPSLLHGLWAMFRDLYLGQAIRTSQVLCSFLAEKIPDSGVDCSFAQTLLNVGHEKDGDPAAVAATAAAAVRGRAQGKGGQDETDGQTRGKVERWAPDVIVADIGVVGIVEISELFGIPLLLNSPTLLFSLEENFQRSSKHLPGWGSGFSRQMTFLQRCINVVYPRLMAVALTPDFVLLNQIRSDLRLEPYESQHAIFKRQRIMVNTAFGFEYPRYVHPTVDFVGPLLPVLRSEGGPGGSRQRPIHEAQYSTGATAVLAWLEEKRAQRSKVVVVSLGSIGLVDFQLFHGLMRSLQGAHVLWVVSQEQGRLLTTGKVNARHWIGFVDSNAASISDDLLHSYFDFCDPSDSEVWNKDFCPVHGMPTVGSASSYAAPKDLFVFERTDDLSMTELLSAKAVAVVISHCGLTAAQDAILALVPLICTPFFADQFDIAARVEDAGVGVTITRDHVGEQLLSAVVPTMREFFRDNLTRMADLLAESGGTARGARLVEAIAHLEPDSLLSRDVVWSWTRVHNFDVYALCIAAIALVAVSSLLAVRPLAQPRTRLP